MKHNERQKQTLFKMYLSFLVLFLLCSNTISQESGTKFMLDETAKTYIRSRLRAYRVLFRMEELADNNFEQRLLFYGELSYERENIEFYLLLVRSLDQGNMMERISDELEHRKTLSVWRTRLQDEEMNILEEFQRHLMPEETSNRRRTMMKRRRKRRLPEGRVEMLDTLVSEYMAARAAATYSYRQATALVGMMSEGLPKKWARLYLEVQQTLETKGLDYLKVLSEEWSQTADRLEKERVPGSYSYGGDGDPDGRMLVLEAFENSEEWNIYLEKRKEQVIYIDEEKQTAPLPTSEPRPTVEMAKDIKHMWYDWWWERRILIFSIFGGFSGGLIVYAWRVFFQKKIKIKSFRPGSPRKLGSPRRNTRNNTPSKRMHT